MNVRFADRHIRFRVQTREFDLLLAGRSLSLDVPMPGAHQFCATVNATPLGEWQLSSDPTGLWLSIPKSALEDLRRSPPGKEGLERQFATAASGALTVAFEVDLRKEHKVAA